MARHVYRGDAVSAAGAAVTELDADAPERDDAGRVEAEASRLRVETVASNPLSGPITVPARVAIGDTGITAQPFALGTSTFGWTLGADDAFAVLDRFAGTGGSLVDTADSYAAGRSESIIGMWLASRRTHGRMSVMTKVGRHPDHPGLAPKQINASVEASLSRLGVERLDLVHFHGEDSEVPLEESLGAIDALIAAGKVGAIGASDFGTDRLIEARVLAANGLPRFQTFTTRYNLMERKPFEGAPELVAHAQGLAVLPYFALANGFLGGQVRRRADVRHDARGARQAKHLGRRGHRVLAAVDEVAFAHGVQPATVALAWLLAKPTIAAPVASATRPEQVDALLAAAAVELTRSELVELDRASA
ncbi:aldo/keto reductase [Agromyces endophyticus]|uniref:aldo/keto reductase n=1 Tax=Agromyces sp. H17E-10 TaxID=2932244 RepID=UPI001FD2D8DA|nr:aldo/keto reductase [Agromyces sp. H17E-10]UOQ89565.1 aldo/keto reductase [Agromyces sp. H17E-10]